MKSIKLSFVLTLVLAILGWDAHAQLIGTMSPDEMVVQGDAIFHITLTATDTIPANTNLHLLSPSGMKNLRWPFLTNIFMSTSGASGINIYSFLSPSALQPPIWDDDNLPVIISAQIKTNPVLPGETIGITLGSNNLNGEMQSHETAGEIEFKIALEDLDGNWTEVVRLPFDNVADVPASIGVVAPSVVQTGQPTVLKLIALDQLYNRNKEFEGTISISADASVTIASSITFTAADTGYIEVPVVFSTEGFYNIELVVTAVSNAGSILAIHDIFLSNYSWVQDNPDYYINWGDLHSHSGWSRDGIGPNTFNYARFTSCLDYFSPAEHINGRASDTLGINPEEWETIKRGILDYHKPGEFVPITAYETSYYANEGGHNIVYFEHHDSAIHEIELYPRLIYHSIFEFWNKLDMLPDHISALSWPHFTGSFSYTDQSEPSWGINDLSINQGPIPRVVGEEYISPYRPLWEIYSQHGQSEYFDESHPLNDEEAMWFFQDALAMNEKLGVTSFTDGHKSKPGFPGGGIGAAMTSDLTRTELFDAFRSRRTYGTTGDRIIMDFRINDTIMGGEVDIENDMVPEISFFVQGTAAIDRVEVVKWDFITGQYGGDFHPDFEVLNIFSVPANETFYENSFIDMDFYGHAVYYMRVIQQNEVEGKPVWGWSSPIWVNNLNFDSTILALDYPNKILDVELYPNPVGKNSSIRISMTSEKNQIMRLSVFDSRGVRYEYMDRPVTVGFNQTDISLKDLPAGQFWIRFTDEYGRLLGSRAFTVQ